MAFQRGNFFEDVKIVPIATYISANTDRNSEVIDTAGFGRCCVVVHFGTIVTNFVGQIYMTSSDAVTNETTLSGGANVAGSAQAIADSDDNTVKYIDFQPDKRYYQVVFDKDAANACAESCICYQYDAKEKVVTHAGGTSTVGDGTAAVTGENLGLAIQGTI